MYNTAMCQMIQHELIEKMEQRLRNSFPKGEFDITDGEDGMHLQVSVTATDFQGKTLMAQHRLVYAAFSDLINSGELHSINIKTIAA